MTRATLLVAAVFTLMSSGVAADITRDTSGPDEPKSFSELDVNGDGSLDEAEVVEAQDPYTVGGVDFDSIDQDGDSEISNDEWDRYLRDQRR